MKKIAILKFCILAIVMPILLSGCWGGVENNAIVPAYQDIYRPIYASTAEVKDVKILPARVLTKPGKIYYKDNMIFVGESGKGVHIIDNKDPKNPQRIAFLSIPANTDIAIKGQTLYADNLTDLVVIDMSDAKNAKLIKRIENTFPVKNYPDFLNVRFECPDASKGVIVGWERITDGANAKCYR